MKNKRIAALSMALALTAALSVPAFAADQSTDADLKETTPVFAGVVVNDKDATLSVTVPTAYAFAVKVQYDDAGTTDADKYKMSVITPDQIIDADGMKTSTGKDANMFKNSSTYKEGDVLTGMPIKVTGTLTSAEDASGWKPVNTVTAGAGNLYEYSISVGGIPFGNVQSTGKTYIAQQATAFGIKAPAIVNGKAVENIEAAELTVAVAGNAKDYFNTLIADSATGDALKETKGQASAKIAEITWEIKGDLTAAP